jgi:proline iminopeptidase
VRVILLVLALAAGAAAGITACAGPAPPPAAATSRTSSYFDHSGRIDVISGGVRMINVRTPKGTFRVWTRRVGNNPKLKVLLLHGGPGATHEYFAAFDSFFPGAGVEYYFYDQLGSAYSDRPTDPELWQIPRFVSEVEHVRDALGLHRENFVLLGHSWGGLLAIEYALAHRTHLKGLIVSNMMSSIPAYNEYAKTTLMPAMDQKALAEITRLETAGRTSDPRYMELLMPHHYEQHVLRMPAAAWPEPVHRMFAHLNTPLYTLMQGPSELGAGGRLANWDRTKELSSITVPTLVIGARHDTMDPAHMEGMAKRLPKGRYLYCPNGSHLAMYDDQQTYMSGVLSFLSDLEKGAL